MCLLLLVKNPKKFFSMASLESIQDIHICGACRTEFLDIYQFIHHKKECYLSATSGGSVLSYVPKQVIQLTDQDTLEPQISALCHDTYPDPSASACVTVSLENPVSAQHTSQMTNGTDQFGLAQPVCTNPDLTHYSVTLNPNSHSNSKISDVSSEQLSYSLLSRSEVIHEPNSIQSEQEKELTIVTNLTDRETEDSRVQGNISADDIAVYVVSPKSFASSVKGQTKFNDGLRNQDHGSFKDNEWANSCLSSTHQNPNLHPYSDSGDKSEATAHVEVSDCITRVQSNFQMASVTGSFYIDGNLTPSSDNSTPCPEDLEVGQISAAMLNKKPGQEHRKNISRSRKDSFPTAETLQVHGKLQTRQTIHLKSKLMIDEADVVSEYTRENTASAPIIKVRSDGQSKKNFGEKRLRLQGISDELLSSSPFLESAHHSASENSKLQTTLDSQKMLTKVSVQSENIMQPASLSQSVKSSALIAPVLTSYKAIFTSPSSAGHRLTPTHLGQAEPMAVCKEMLLNSYHSTNSQLSHSDSKTLSSQALVLKNISGSVGSQVHEHQASSNFIASPEVRQRKTERQLNFEESESSVSRSTMITLPGTNPNCVVSAGSYQNKKDNEILSDKEYFNETSSSFLESSTAVNTVVADISQLSTVSLSNTATANQTGLDNYNLMKYTSELQNSETQTQTSSLQMVSTTRDGHISSSTLPDSGSTSSSQKTEIVPSADSSVIMVYKNRDGSVMMVPKSICSSPTTQQDTHHAAPVFQTDTIRADGSVSFSQDHQNYLLKQDLPQQQNSDSSIYIDVVNSDDAELSHQHQLMQNLATTDFTQQDQRHLLKGSASSTTFCMNLCPTTSKDKANNCTNVDVLKINPGPKQPSSRQKGSVNPNEEREKYIIRPRKTAGSSQTSNISGQQMKKSLGPLKRDPSVTSQAPSSNGGSVKVNAEEGQDNKKERLFICKFDNCRYTTGLYKDFQRHYRTHTGERPFLCKECGKTFNRSDKLKIHLRWHAGTKPFQCHLCDYASLEGGSLKKHMRIHTDERPFKCQICSYASRNSSQLIVHLRTHTGDSPFHCTMCAAQFKMNSDLKRHMRVHTGEKPFQCDSCDYKSSNKGNLKTHIRINHSKENEMRCPKCEFVTSSKKRLGDHAKTHDSKRVVRCTQCEYTCTNLSALRNHASVHNTVKPYRCSYCPYSSNQSGNLKKHVQNLHHDKLLLSRFGKTDNVTANTNKSMSSNRQESTLLPLEKRPNSHRQHRNTQSYRKRHTCQECGSGFVREDSLRCHMKQHSANVEGSSVRGGIARCSQRALKDFQTNDIGKQAISAPSMRQGIHHIVAAAKYFEENSGSIDVTNNSSTSEFQSPAMQGSGISNTPNQTIHVSSNECGNTLSKPTCSQKSFNGTDDNNSLHRISRQLPWEHRSYTLSVPSDDEENTDKTSHGKISSSTSSRPSSKLSPHSSKVDRNSQSHTKPQYKTPQYSNVQINPQKSISQHESFHSHKRRKVTKAPLTTSTPGSKSFQVINKTVNPPYQQFQQQPQIVLQHAVPHANSTIEVSGIPGMEPTLVFTQQHGDVGNSEPTFNIQLVPQVSALQQGSTQTSTISQEILQQLSLQVVPQIQPATQIQIVLPGATVPNSTQVIQEGGQTYLPQPQQIMLQVQDNCDQPQEMITIPINQLSSSQSQVSPLMLNYLTSQPSAQGAMQAYNAVKSHNSGLTDILHVLSPTTSQPVTISPHKTVTGVSHIESKAGVSSVSVCAAALESPQQKVQSVQKTEEQ